MYVTIVIGTTLLTRAEPVCHFLSPRLEGVTMILPPIVSLVINPGLVKPHLSGVRWLGMRLSIIRGKPVRRIRTGWLSMHYRRLGLVVDHRAYRLRRSWSWSMPD